MVIHAEVRKPQRELNNCCFVLLHCLFFAALWPSAWKGLATLLSCVLCFLVFSHFPICGLIHIRTKGEVGTVKHV